MIYPRYETGTLKRQSGCVTNEHNLLSEKQWQLNDGKQMGSFHMVYYCESLEKLHESHNIFSDLKTTPCSRKIIWRYTTDKVFHHASVQENELQVTSWHSNSANHCGGNLLSKVFNCLCVRFFSPGIKMPFCSCLFFIFFLFCNKIN